MIHQNKVNLDVTRVCIGEEGVEDFLWPLNSGEMTGSIRALIARLVPLGRYSIHDADESHELFCIAFPFFLEELIFVFRTLRVRGAYKKRGYKIQLPQKFRLGSAILDEREPGPSPFLRTLRGGPARAKFYTRPVLRWMKYREWNGLSPRMFFPADPLREIIATQYTPLIVDHVKTATKPVRYQHLSDWFDRDIQGKSFSDRWRDWIETLLDTAAAGMEDEGAPLPDFLRDYFRQWLEQAFSWIADHRDRLLSRSRELPVTLWCGTAGNIWTRILRYAVRKNGGAVIAHDHGHGVATSKRVELYFWEYESCDQFFTFSRLQKTCARKYFDERWAMCVEKPEFESLREHDDYEAALHVKIVREKIYRILCPTPVLFEENLYMPSCMDDFVAVDWQARLFGCLTRWGYHVLYKPHPTEGLWAKPLTQFEEIPGVETLHQPFEQVCEQTDAFLLDYTTSTIFPRMMRTTKPIVLIDFGFDIWYPEYAEILQKRCAVVPGTFDENNRAQVDWNLLHETIRSLEA